MSLTKVSYSMIEGAPISIKDFGAVGNGVADDTAAIQAAFDYAKATVSGYPKTVFIPSGDYLVTQPLKAWGQLNIIGQGINSRIIGDFSGAVLEIGQRSGASSTNRTTNCLFQDFNVQSGANSDIGIQWVNLQRCSINNVKVSAAGAIKSDYKAHRIGGEVYTNEWIGLRAQRLLAGTTDGYGLFIGNDLDLWNAGATAFINANTFVGTHCTGFGVGIQLDGNASGCHFLQPTTEGGIGYGIVVKGGQTNVIDTWWNENTLSCLFTQATIKQFGGGTTTQNGTANRLINNTRLGSSFAFEYQSYSVVENFNLNAASSLDANCAYCSLINIRQLGGGALTDNGTNTFIIKGFNNSWVSYGLAGRGELISDSNGIRLENTVSGSYIAFDSAGVFGGNAKINSTLAPSTDETISIGRDVLRFLDGFIKQIRPGAGGVIWTSGSGTPEGAVTAPVGSLFTRTDGGANTTLYVKESGTGNTGWVAK